MKNKTNAETISRIRQQLFAALNNFRQNFVEKKQVLVKKNDAYKIRQTTKQPTLLRKWCVGKNMFSDTRALQNIFKILLITKTIQKLLFHSRNIHIYIYIYIYKYIYIYININFYT